MEQLEAAGGMERRNVSADAHGKPMNRASPWRFMGMGEHASPLLAAPSAGHQMEHG